jgi:peroxiredoxin
MPDMTANPFPLPPNLPVPVDDDAACHLPGMALPDVVLAATDGSGVPLARLAGRWVIYVYPMTGRPGVALPEGWDGIPGARGCTPQSCAFRDHHAELRALGTGVFGLSAQTTNYQREARDRLHLPFELLSDSGLELKATLRLPTFAVAGIELYKRLTLVVDDARIVKAFYPVFPPDRNAADVLEWLRGHALPAPGRAGAGARL